ncbi:Alpha-ketoglutarate-dependent dioxygenase alkB 6 [Quaeritorhiza haematococci]|nr:Alpha-ketoglutarate-dependent dioxygenase alkB 6 [Quaeritorhiza haematococci]
MSGKAKSRTTNEKSSNERNGNVEEVSAKKEKNPLTEKKPEKAIPMLLSPLPDWLDRLGTRISDLNAFSAPPPTSGANPTSSSPANPTKVRPNQCLVNEYLPGQGIMPHEDGPAYWPTVATVSLGCHCLLDFYSLAGGERNVGGAMNAGDSGGEDRDEGEERDERVRRKPDFSILVPPRSLLVLRDEMYLGYMHGIEETEEDVLDVERIVNLAGEGVVEYLRDDLGINVEKVRKRMERKGKGEGAGGGEESGERGDMVCAPRTRARVSLTFRVAKNVKKIPGLFRK